MKIAIKNKTEWKYVDAEELEINGKKVSELYEQIHVLQEAYQRLTKLLQNKLIVSPNKEYVVELKEELRKIDGLKLHDVPDGDVPIKYYKVEDGKLIVDRKKVGAAW